MTDATALIAQFGLGNVAANAQGYESSNVLAGIVQVGNGNTALNTQGNERLRFLASCSTVVASVTLSSACLGLIS